MKTRPFSESGNETGYPRPTTDVTAGEKGVSDENYVTNVTDVWDRSDITDGTGANI